MNTIGDAMKTIEQWRASGRSVTISFWRSLVHVSALTSHEDYRAADIESGGTVFECVNHMAACNEAANCHRGDEDRVRFRDGFNGWWHQDGTTNRYTKCTVQA